MTQKYSEEKYPLLELASAGVVFERQRSVPVLYKGSRLSKSFRSDYIFENQVVVELKSAVGLTRYDQRQILNYLKASGCRLGLLSNFGTSRLTIRRYIL